MKGAKTFQCAAMWPRALSMPTLVWVFLPCRAGSLTVSASTTAAISPGAPTAMNTICHQRITPIPAMWTSEIFISTAIRTPVMISEKPVPSVMPACISAMPRVRCLRGKLSEMIEKIAGALGDSAAPRNSRAQASCTNP